MDITLETSYTGLIVFKDISLDLKEGREIEFGSVFIQVDT